MYKFTLSPQSVQVQADDGEMQWLSKYLSLYPKNVFFTLKYAVVPCKICKARTFYSGKKGWWCKKCQEYQTGWDGSERFFNLRTRTFSIGFWPHIRRKLKRQNKPYKIIKDSRDKISPIESVEFTTERLYPDQIVALNKWLAWGGRGIVWCAPGFGKTELAMGAVQVLKERGLIRSALFVCSGLDSVIQTRERFAKQLGKKHYVEIINIQALARLIKNRDTNTTQHLRKIDFLIIDECFVGSTLVDGKAISGLKAGDLVNSFNHENGQVESRKIVHVFKNPVRSLIKISVNDRTICCTPSHPFYVFGKGYVPASNITLGDLVYASNLPDMQQRFLIPVRVDDIKILEPRSDGEFECVCPEGFVYNLEIEHNNNYFVEGILVHNCHHGRAAEFKKLVALFKGKYRLGISASPFHDYKRNDLHSMRSDDAAVLKLLGPVVARYSASTLIEKGRLAKPIVFFYPLPDNGWALPDNPSWPLTRRIMLTENEAMHSVIGKFVKTAALAEEQSLVVAGGIKRLAFNVWKALDRRDVNAKFLHGGVDKQYRNYTRKKLIKGEIDAICATTIYDEAVDLPNLRVLALAYGGLSEIKLEQRIGRDLRKKYGSNMAIVLEFLCTSNKHLKKHTYARIKHYLKERAFEFRLVGKHSSQVVKMFAGRAESIENLPGVDFFKELRNGKSDSEPAQDLAEKEA